MVKQIALGGAVAVGLAVATVLALAAGKPDTFRIERSVSIQAPADKIFPLITNFRAWTDWSPFEKLDPTMKKTYSGAETGKGAKYAWAGDGHAGEGTMEITEAVAPSKVTLQLAFTKPMEALNTTEFTLVPEGGATKVTWAMHGPQPFISKVMGVFMDMDKLIGPDFESGLAAMKVAAEK
ncbi:MAG: SRPBCC family protein [Candidatus Sericytochromatia bacterium]